MLSLDDNWRCRTQAPLPTLDRPRPGSLEVLSHPYINLGREELVDSTNVRDNRLRRTAWLAPARAWLMYEHR